jgi:hypothetical protein
VPSFVENYIIFDGAPKCGNGLLWGSFKILNELHWKFSLVRELDSTKNKLWFWFWTVMAFQRPKCRWKILSEHTLVLLVTLSFSKTKL